MATPKFEPNKISETKHLHPFFKRELLNRYPDAYIYKPPGGAYGKKGAHDFLFCVHGLLFSVEIKVEDKDMTPKQEETRDSVRMAGGFSDVCKGKDITIFDRIQKHINEFKVNS